ncbi:hypothetical protein [Bradyrhizobium sp. CCBAU 21360]|uniref:hypothetical protein n=1 Tax=Bradyrhizobium sp. CCBAU 21360 TaxID=1325081 RepID=UPI0023053387|nr:hypothetical protein [Bradyrhizobium sp. CCBAU 21360]MDA9445794.1 hypothetical protein [Bradyrhizobium sp. CCBAU 21360]
MSGTSWIYAPKGKIAIYRERDYIYSMTGEAKYFVSDDWWYEIDGGAGKDWTQDNWVYTTSGKAAFRFATPNPELRFKECATAPRNPHESLRSLPGRSYDWR